MKVLYDLGRINKFRGCALALGIFDGVHLAHQFVLKKARDYARQNKIKSIAVTFYPHPQAESSISSLAHRIQLIERLGIDVCLVVSFTKNFAHTSADNFIRHILVGKLSPRAVFVGENFNFGKNASGNVSLLKKYSRIYNFKLYALPIKKQNNKPISSTQARGLIIHGKLNLAEKLLGRPVSILGTVVKGTKLGRKWGIPTANLNPHHEVMPPLGIYATRVSLFGRRYKAVCYIGKKPTFKGGREKFIEVHIMNFKKNLYGKDLEVQFVKKIRSDKKFHSEAELVKQIRRDIARATLILNR